jgi:hypothetical protein
MIEGRGVLTAPEEMDGFVVYVASLSEDDMIKFAAVLPLLLAQTALAIAAQAPVLDVKATCRRAQPLSGGDVSAYQSCMNDELAAQKELTKKWSTFKSGPQAVCTQSTKNGGAPSYVELITCLELDQQAAQAAIENRKALNVPRPAKAAPRPK